MFGHARHPERLCLTRSPRSLSLGTYAQVATWNASVLFSDDLDEAFGSMMERRRAEFRGD